MAEYDRERDDFVHNYGVLPHGRKLVDAADALAEAVRASRPSPVDPALDAAVDKLRAAHVEMYRRFPHEHLTTAEQDMGVAAGEVLRAYDARKAPESGREAT